MRPLLRTLLSLAAVPAAWYAAPHAVALWQSHTAQGLCTVSVVPLGEFSADLLADSVQAAEQTYGVRIRVEAPIPITQQAIDLPRQQLIGEELMGLMKARLPEQANDPRIMLLGLTHGDMYLRQQNWRFAFAGREAGRFAVISTARMDPEVFGLARKDTVLKARLRKMVLKQLGVYFYGLPQRHEKTSVLYSPILGVDDLDEVAEGLDATDRARFADVPKRC